MKCKAHPYEDGVGVCASCLRERLLALIAAQNHLPPPPPPPPPAFPRSVSPYVCPRRSLGSDAPRHRHRRFFSTPQVGPDAAAGEIGGGRRSAGRFSLFATLFGFSRSDGPDDSRSSGSSWFASLIRNKKKKKSRRRFDEEASGKSRPSDRGMSPVRDVEEEDGDSSSSSGYSTESSGGWRKPHPTPMWRPASKHHHHHHHRGHGGRGGVYGFAVCLSPLVRPSPNGRRGHGPEAEIRATSSTHHHRHVSAAATSLVLNRSRKLADIGRFR